MKYYFVLLLWVGLATPYVLPAQIVPAVIGEKIEPGYFKVLADSSNKADLIILDFWNFRCLSCLQSFEKIDSLQQQFGDRLQIILVNRESEDSTRSFFEKRKRLIKPRVKFISGDRVLQNVFEHEGEPFQVWLDAEGKYLHAGSGHTLTNYHINDFLTKHRPPTMSNNSVEYASSLFNPRWQDSLVGFSYLSRCIEQDFVRIKANSKYEGLILSRGCSSIEELYAWAYNEKTNQYYGYKRPGRIIWQAEDVSKFKRPPFGTIAYSTWINQHAYVYHLSVPPSKIGDKYKIMQQDLDRYFGLQITKERRMVSSLVLKKIGNTDLLTSKGGSPVITLSLSKISDTTVKQTRQFINGDFQDFSERLGFIIEEYLKIPYSDKTGLSGKIDIYLSASALDNLNLNLLNRELKPYGLALAREEIMLSVLVIKE